VGFEAVADGLLDGYYRRVKLGRLSERTGWIEDDPGRLTRHRRLSTMSPVCAPIGTDPARTSVLQLLARAGDCPIALGPG